MGTIKEKNTKKNQSVEKAFNIIEHLAQVQKPQRLQDIADALDMSSSTVLRFLGTLMGCGYVKQDEESLRYSLTYRICTVANKVSSSQKLQDILQPYVREVAEHFRESACAAIEGDMDVIYIVAEQGPDQMLRTMQRIGNVAPMYCTGVGKLLLLNHDQGFIDRMIEEKGMQTFTEHTISTREALMKELEQVRKDQYAFDREECEIGAKCISVPVRDYTGHVIAGISVTGPAFRIDSLETEENIRYLAEVGKKASRDMGYEE